MMTALPTLTSSVVPDSKYVDAARKRNATIQQILQVKLDRIRHATVIAQERNERQRKRVERSLCELRLETEAVASDAVVKSMLQRRVRGLLRDIDELQVVWTGSKSQQQLWAQVRRGAAAAASDGRPKSSAKTVGVKSVSIEEFDRRLAQWRRERSVVDRQTCCVHRDPRFGTPCFVPNVETQHLNGGYHLCLYKNT